MLKRKVSIVGSVKKTGLQGKTHPKIFIFRDAAEKLGFETKFFSTAVSKVRILKLINNFRKAFKYGDTIIFFLGGNGSRKLLGLILFFNRIYKKRIILNPFGTGPLNPLLVKKDATQVFNFINKNDFQDIKDDRIGKKLSKFDCILVQTAILKRCYEKFYNIENVVIAPNLRFASSSSSLKLVNTGDYCLNIIFISRVTETKGILDLMSIVNELNQNKLYNVSLNIYGTKHLSEESNFKFLELLEGSEGKIQYLGTIPNEQVIDTIRKHEISCLPTRHNGEGAPGFLIESLIAGVPIITSSFSQVANLVTDKVEGLIYELGNTEQLKEKIQYVLNNKEILNKLSANALLKGKTFTFEYNKEIIKNYITG